MKELYSENCKAEKETEETRMKGWIISTSWENEWRENVSTAKTSSQVQYSPHQKFSGFQRNKKITFLWKERDSRELKNNSEQKNSAEGFNNLI